MGTFKSFEDIEAWQKTRELTRQIYEQSNKGLLSKDFGLRDQMRKACISMMSNVAEGFERSGTGEIRAQLYIALDQGYFDKETFDQLSSQAKEISRMIGSLMNYLKKTKIKGTKYKT